MRTPSTVSSPRSFSVPLELTTERMPSASSTPPAGILVHMDTPEVVHRAEQIVGDSIARATVAEPTVVTLTDGSRFEIPAGAEVLIAPRST